MRNHKFWNSLSNASQYTDGMIKIVMISELTD